MIPFPNKMDLEELTKAGFEKIPKEQFTFYGKQFDGRMYLYIARIVKEHLGYYYIGSYPLIHPQQIQHPNRNKTTRVEMEHPREFY